ncbi:hypothetical protein DMI62_13965 [Escherichia coli]|nr:hypothetical protein [Escherichia coli]
MSVIYDFACFCLTINLILHFLTVKHAHRNYLWQGWLKWQQKIITNVSGIAHLLVGLDSVIADIAQIFPCTKQSGKYAK